MTNDLSGRTFGHLLVLYPVPDPPHYYYCACDCGRSLTVAGSSLTSGNTRSCGHLRLKDAPLHHLDPVRHQGRDLALRSACGWAGLTYVTVVAFRNRAETTNQLAFEEYYKSMWGVSNPLSTPNPDHFYGPLPPEDYPPAQVYHARGIPFPPEPESLPETPSGPGPEPEPE